MLKIKYKYNSLLNKFEEKAKLELHSEGEFISDQIRKFGHHYEVSELRYCLKNFNCSYFVDIGANIGNHTNFFMLHGANCVAFEPSIKNYNLLKINAPGATVLNVALSDQCHKEKLVTYGSCMGNSNLISNFGSDGIQPWGDTIEVEEVEVRTLDSFNLTNVTLLKVDVEGAELKVLNGANNTIRKFKPVVWIEVHTDEILERGNYPYRRKDIDDYFCKIGYSKITKNSLETNLYYQSVN